MPGSISIDNDLIKFSINKQYTATGRVSSNLEGFIEHFGLGYKKRMVGRHEDDLRQRLFEQAKTWQGEWIAREHSMKARELIRNLEGVLLSGSKQSFSIDWEELKDRSKLKLPKPILDKTEPKLEDQEPKVDILDRLIFKSNAKRKLKQQKKNYQRVLREWEVFRAQYEKNLKKWNDDKLSFYKKQEEFNSRIDQVKQDYYIANSSSIEFYYESLLKQSEYPIKFNRQIAVQYNKKQKLLVVELNLPDIGDIPKIREVIFVKTKEGFVEKYLTESQHKKLYDSVIYQICLRTIYEIFKSDEIEAIDSVILNGWVITLNKATGKRQTICILSIQVDKSEFLEIDLKNVDPRICFKTLKGIAAAELSGLAAVAPILQIDKSDKRFIKGQKVVTKIDDSTNIAAMNWEDFEHLVRELFEREFEDIKGEVKVTQSSRDRGVDAVAFDPDPIKGGKIIIQAKRYTNTVKVESVRALYGIMQDEGAMKGILITTSDFGSDAYHFAKDKPITLLSGNNLLSMLEKHGHKARINLKEAKRVLNERGEI